MNWPWQSPRRESIPVRAALLPLSAVSLGYRALVHADRALYARGLRLRRRVDARVISVGSLVVGGSGKTPMASWLAKRLHRRGHKVALLSRGYGGRPAQPVTIVSDGQRVLTGVNRAGDEPVLLAGQTAGVPVIVSRDRGLAALRAISVYGAEIVILDDGFQHHRLDRDLDLLTFETDFGFGNGHLLPRGPLREPLRGLRRAHAIIEIDEIGQTQTERPSQVSASSALHAPEALRFRAHRRAVSLRDLKGTVAVAPEVLRGMRVAMIAGIAHPESLRRTLRALGAELIAERVFRDHHRYRARDFRGLADSAPVWITTEKDACKILPSWVGGADVRVLGAELVLPEEEVFIDWIEKRLALRDSL
jgi:tetraacyldisaccharide 4'-kinase